MSAISLTAGMRQNLFSLQQTNNMMDKTASRLATGKKVQTALDDPINFFAAQGHNQRAGDLAQRKDQMGEAIQTIKAANNGIEAITDLISSAKALANSANAIDVCTTASRRTRLTEVPSPTSLMRS
jgi:flagellin-like hook-associated protein FlgL